MIDVELDHEQKVSPSVFLLRNMESIVLLKGYLPSKALHCKYEIRL